MGQSQDTKTPDPIEFLILDHRAVDRLFTQFDEAKEEQSRQRIIREAVAAVAVHAAIEEEIFYPAARALIADKQLIDTAIEEHAEVKRVMDNLAETHDAPARSEKFLALARLVKERVKEEETQLFPKLDAKRADFSDLGAQLRRRKEELRRVSLFL